jgi:hypothetical protein
MTIPASEFVNVIPGVINGGGSPLSLNGLILSQDTHLPTKSVTPFGSSSAVAAFFGPGSPEFFAADQYFLGFDGSTIKPNTLLFAPYVAADRAAWLTSGSLAGVTLTQLQAFSGTLALTVDGTLFTSSSINLATAVSFSDAATKITAAFSGSGHPVCAWDAVRSTFVLSSSTTGNSSTITYATAGTLANNLLLTQATGAILSQGQVADTPTTAMNNAVTVTQNWATFTTMFEPIDDNKLLFAQWANSKNSRYLYVAWDTNAQAIINGGSCFGNTALAAQLDGTMCVSGSSADCIAQGTTLAAAALNLAVFTLGVAASIDFAATNGRVTLAYKHSSGFIPTVTNQQSAANLLANGYSYYGAVATANTNFNFAYDGRLTGEWKWFDTFLNQVRLNSQFQLALLNQLTIVKSIPYTPSGYSLIRTTMQDAINEGLNFGSIRPGVILSESQKAAVNQAAGVDISNPLLQQGYYLQVKDPGAQVRANRGTPIVNFWYTDGGAVHKITVNSIDIL